MALSSKTVEEAKEIMKPMIDTSDFFPISPAEATKALSQVIGNWLRATSGNIEGMVIGLNFQEYVVLEGLLENQRKVTTDFIRDRKKVSFYGDSKGKKELVPADEDLSFVEAISLLEELLQFPCLNSILVSVPGERGGYSAGPYVMRDIATESGLTESGFEGLFKVLFTIFFNSHCT